MKCLGVLEMKTLTRLLSQYDRTSKGLGFKADDTIESGDLARLTKITTSEQLTTVSSQDSQGVIVDTLDNIDYDHFAKSSILIGYDAREAGNLPPLTDETPISFAIIDLTTELASLQFHDDFSIVLALEQNQLSEDPQNLYSLLRGRQALPLAAILLDDKNSNELRNANSIFAIRSLSDATSLPLIMPSGSTNPSEEEMIDLKTLGVRALLA